MIYNCLTVSRDTTVVQGSTDGGETWTTIYSGSSLVGNLASDVANRLGICYGRNTWVIVGNAGSATSTDGLSWNKVNHTLFNHSPVTLFYSEVTDSFFATKTSPTINSYVYKSSDGLNWVMQFGGLGYGLTNLTFAINPINPSNWIIAGFKYTTGPSGSQHYLAYYSSVNSGVNWSTEAIVTDVYADLNYAGPAVITHPTLGFIFTYGDYDSFSTRVSGISYRADGYSGNVKSVAINKDGFIVAITSGNNFYYGNYNSMNPGIGLGYGYYSVNWILDKFLAVSDNNPVVRYFKPGDSLWGNTAQILPDSFYSPIATNGLHAIVTLAVSSSTAKVFSNTIRSLVRVAAVITSATIGILLTRNFKIVLNAVSSSLSAMSNSITKFVSTSVNTVATAYFPRIYFLVRQAVALSSGQRSFKKFWSFLWSLVYAADRWVGVKKLTNIAAWSIDGEDWTNVALPVTGNWSSIARGSTTTVAVATDSNVALTAIDNNFIERTLPSASKWNSVITDNGTTFVTVALDSDKCATSTDSGVTWSEYSLPQKSNWTSVTYGNGLFVAVGDSGIAATSPDGIVWTARALPDQLQFNSVVWANNQFTAVASGPTNLAAKSADGITWERIYMPSAQNWTAVGPGVGNPNV